MSRRKSGKGGVNPKDQASKALLADPDRDFAVSASLANVEKIALTEWPVAGELMLVAGPLRSLFLYDTLQSASNAHQIPVRIPPTPTDFVRTATPLRDVVFANGGECTVWGTRVHGFEFSGPHVGYSHTQTSDPRGMKIKDFLDDPVVVINGVKITRWQVVRYVANKMGARHYDRLRGEHNDRSIDQARAAFYYDLFIMMRTRGRLLSILTIA